MSMNFFMFKALTVTNLSNNTLKSTTTREKICCWNVEKKAKEKPSCRLKVLCSCLGGYWRLLNYLWCKKNMKKIVFNNSLQSSCLSFLLLCGVDWDKHEWPKANYLKKKVWNLILGWFVVWGRRRECKGFQKA